MFVKVNYSNVFLMYLRAIQYQVLRIVPSFPSSRYSHIVKATRVTPSSPRTSPWKPRRQSGSLYRYRLFTFVLLFSTVLAMGHDVITPTLSPYDSNRIYTHPSSSYTSSSTLTTSTSTISISTPVMSDLDLSYQVYQMIRQIDLVIVGMVIAVLLMIALCVNLFENHIGKFTVPLLQ